MKRSKGLFRYEGYFAFKIACEIHEALFPGKTRIDGGSRKMRAIYRALDKVYTDGVEDAVQHDDAWIAAQRRWILREPPRRAKARTA